VGQQRHFDRVWGLVSGHSGTPESEITLESRLVEDLGIDGDDGCELLEGFADEFGVDMSGMDSFCYFDDEPPLSWFSHAVPVLAAIVPRFRRYVLHATRGRRAVTVRDLVASARARRWIRPAHRRTDLDPVRVTWRSMLVMGLVTPLLALMVFVTLNGLLGAYAEASAATFLLPVIVLALLGGKFLMALHWLRRHDNAARYEEAAAGLT